MDDKTRARRVVSGERSPRCSPSAGSTSDVRIEAYQEQLRRLVSELSLAEARERREIASDLHDHIGQALAFVAQKVGILRGNSVFSGMEHDFSEILSILDQTIRYTRDLTVEISPPVLYELGLPAAIDWLADRALHRYGLPVSSLHSGTPREMAEDVRVFLFKAVQELITNVTKHAAASQATIRTTWLATELTVVVTDDGRGFDSAAFESGPSTGTCFGLFNIRERLAYIGGTMDIDSAPGRGTRVAITAPCGNPKDSASDQDSAGR